MLYSKPNNLKVNLRDNLYKNLPNIYHREDAKNGYALQKVLQVLGTGLNEIEQYINDLSNVYDIDKCPAQFLPLIAQYYGVEFPYSFDEATQRKFLKVIPKLYENKGTDTAFRYLAREIFGQATVTSTEVPVKPPEMSMEEWIESGEWKKLFVTAEVDGETYRLDDKANQFIKFSEILRPVNTILIPHLVFFYKDDYDRGDKVIERFDWARVSCDDDLENAIKVKLDVDHFEVLKDIIHEETYDFLAKAYDTDQFYLNTSALNSQHTLSTWFDKTIIKVVAEIENFTRIVYEDGDKDLLSLIDQDTFTATLTDTVLDVVKGLDTETYSINVSNYTTLDTLRVRPEYEVKFIASSDDSLDSARYRGTDVDTFTKTKLDTYDTTKSISKRNSHLLSHKLVTNLRTTDFIPVN